MQGLLFFVGFSLFTLSVWAPNTVTVGVNVLVCLHLHKKEKLWSKYVIYLQVQLIIPFKFQLFTFYYQIHHLYLRNPDLMQTPVMLQHHFPVEVNIISIVLQIVILRNWWKLAQLMAATRPKSNQKHRMKRLSSDIRKKNTVLSSSVMQRTIIFIHIHIKITSFIFHVSQENL